MPEDIPAVEDIKFARKRLEELAVTEEQESPNFVEKLAAKLATPLEENKKTDAPAQSPSTPGSETHPPTLSYKIPENVALLEKLTTIIKGYPGDKKVNIGEHNFLLSSEGIRLLKILFEE